jgi:hypothetical protein
MEIACVHGSPPYVYLGYENLYSDPNLICDVLYRTLRAEQEKRGGKLPKILYIQLDNCIRENKNTAFFCYVSWLVERGIFHHIYVSFLPVGHTHFDCDALASRISVAFRYNDVLDLQSLVEYIRHCNFPSPIVVVIDAVPDVKGLFNPTGEQTFPVTTSRVRRCAGCSTKEHPQRERDFYMGATSPLHWFIRKDLLGKVFVQTKLTCDDTQWSTQFYPWTPNAPRPDNRDFEPSTSGLRPSDLRMAAQKPLTETRAIELKRSIPQVEIRLTTSEWEEVTKIYDMLRTDVHLELRVVPHGGLFIDELDEPAPPVVVEHEQEEARLFLRPPSRVFNNTNRQAIDRLNRKRRGRARSELVIGNFVAITTNYLDSVPEAERQDFWVGKIISLDYETEDLHISYYHTAALQCLTKDCMYRAWTGRYSKDWVSISRVLHTFDDFTARKRINAENKRLIGAAIDLPADESEAEPDEDEGAGEDEGDEGDEGESD